MKTQTISRPVDISATRNTMSLGRIVVLALLVLGAALPYLTEGAPFLLILASHAAIAAIVALSLDLLTGNVGLLTFGHAAWYGFGAYAAGLISINLTAEMLYVLPLTAVITAAIAASVGIVLVRQIGKTFAILTLAFSQIMFAAVFVFSKVTGGEDGLQGIPNGTLFGYEVASKAAWYWLLYIVLLVSLVAALHFRRTPMGRACIAIRENTERSRFIGLDVRRLKLIAFVASASLGSVAGGLHALFTGASSPDLLHWVESGKILMYVVLGGVGTIVGPVLGAGVFTLAEHYVSSWTDAWQIYFGALFVLIVIVAPGGLYGACAKLAKRIGSKSRGDQ